jgi:hypothetical protein
MRAASNIRRVQNRRGWRDAWKLSLPVDAAEGDDLKIPRMTIHNFEAIQQLAVTRLTSAVLDR